MSQKESLNEGRTSKPREPLNPAKPARQTPPSNRRLGLFSLTGKERTTPPKPPVKK